MAYHSDLTNSQWQLIKHHFPTENRGRHLSKHSKRKLVNAVLYIVKTGCQ
ncbi:MAG: transposase, partial [Clostridiales bacterium]|nr:transposase [Clostridiales bacterium]